MIELQFLILTDDGEKRIARSRSLVVPRKDEIVWLQRSCDFIRDKEVLQQEAWQVDEVCYWAPDVDGGYDNLSIQSVAIYLKPIKKTVD